MKPNKGFLLVGIITLAILSIFISNSINKTNTDTRSHAVYTNKISFPKDHLFHSNFKREWWYINLLIRTDDKEIRDTGYVISLGMADNTYALLTSKYDDYSKKFSENTYSPGKISSTLGKSNLFTISYSQDNGPTFTLKELTPLPNGAKRYSLKGNSPQTGTLNLTLTEKTVSSKGYNTPLLWGCDGNISVFKPNDTYYYSIPDLDITGTVKDSNGSIKKVKVGKAWMDHQWFNSSPNEDPDSTKEEWQGHYWTDHYLTQRNDFSGPHTAIGAVTQIYNGKPKYSYWVKRNTNGTNECGTNVEFNIEKIDKKSGYPNLVTIDITNSKKQLIYSGKLLPFNHNQIFKSLGQEFFEPMSYIMSGTLGKQKVTGLGFFETGIKK